MKTFLTGASLLLLVVACGEGVSEKQPAATASVVKAAAGTYAVGTTVTREGAIAAESAGDSFRRGPGVYLSIDVASASIDQMIEVRWIGPAGRVMRREARQVREGTQYATFDSGNTTAWMPGPYRAVITINDRTVHETPFALI